MLGITALYAGLIALLFMVLSFRVIGYRRSNQIGLGDAGDKSLLKRMRAQANCAEYAPIGLILLALVEAQGTPGWVVHGLGLMLLAGRLAHGYGFSASPPVMNLRVGGMLLTTGMIALAAIGLIAHALV
ncbi:MAG: MAPEG family protein [Pseudomonadota bacterium]